MKTKEEIIEVLTRQKKMLEDMGYTVAYIALYGSQNYGLDLYTDEYQSDIDTKAIIIPTLDDLVNNSKPVSCKVESDTGEIDVKDIRVFMETLLKANPAYIETIFTDYYIIDDKFQAEMGEMLSKREKLISTLRIQHLKALYGMMLEKQNALCHPYPTIAWKINKYGYDGKQASHMYRLFKIMYDYYGNHKPYKDCLIPNGADRDTMIEYKLNKYTLEEALSDTEHWSNQAKIFKDSYLDIVNESKIDYSIKDEYLALSKKIIKDKIENEIVNNWINEFAEKTRNKRWIED